MSLEEKLRSLSSTDLDRSVLDFFGPSFGFDDKTFRVGDEEIPAVLALALTSEARSKPAEPLPRIRIEDLQPNG